MASKRKVEVEIVGDSRSLERAFKRSGRSASSFQRDVSKRGLSAGKTFGAAFGIGLGIGTITTALSAFIREATEQEVAQRQLAAQFKANRQNLAAYNAEITTAVNKLSLLAGIEDDEVLSAFTLAFRATKNVTEGLRLTAIAADVAKGRHIELAAATIALSKAYGGQTTALKRLGIQVPANLKGMAALEFVARRFAGQAAAGTTAQERFTVAFRNMEQVIGTALLPTFNKLTNQLSAWIGDERNQAKVQQGVTDAVTVTVGVLKVLAEAYRIAAGAADLYNKTVGKIKVPGLGSLVDIVKKGTPAGQVLGVLELLGGGGDGKLRAGQSPIGENALGQAAAAAKATGKPGAAGLLEKFRKAELAEARARLTRTKADDREALLLEAAILKEQIKSKKKVFKDKAALTNQLAGVLDSIQSIDDEASQERVDASEKAADRAKKAADKERAARKKARDAVRRAAKEALDAAKEQARSFRELIATERDRIGELFGGPVFAPTEAQQKRALGAPTPGSNVKALIADLKAQLQQFKVFERDLARLAKRGAPPQLLAELRQGGLAIAPQVHALATAGGADFAQFKKLFVQRERLAVEAAKQERPVNIHLNVYVDGVTGKVHVVRTKPHGQTRGRSPGLSGTAFLVNS